MNNTVHESTSITSLEVLSVTGFLGDLPFPPPFHSGAAPYTHFRRCSIYTFPALLHIHIVHPPSALNTVAVKIRPNLFSLILMLTLHSFTISCFNKTSETLEHRADVYAHDFTTVCRQVNDCYLDRVSQEFSSPTYPTTKAARLSCTPLLPSNGSVIHSPTSEYDSDDNAEGLNVQHRNGGASNGVITIDIPTPKREEPRFPKEKWKSLMAFLILVVNFILTTVSLALVHERLPDREKYGPLPDIVIDNIAPVDWALNVSEILIVVSTNVTFLIILFHKHRFIVMRRVFMILSLLYLMRSITMYVTVLPHSSKTYYCSPKLNETSTLIIMKRVWQLLSGFGLSMNGQHTFCGDFIYSGHTVILTMSYLTIAECELSKALFSIALGILVLLGNWSDNGSAGPCPLYGGCAYCLLRDDHSLLGLPHHGKQCQPQGWFSEYVLFAFSFQFNVLSVCEGSTICMTKLAHHLDSHEQGWNLPWSCIKEPFWHSHAVN
ncbi:hypothetical protein PR048_029140 [Dryococelus australis]|uniref:Sphingomyelin synthase-like domain-containing protein n=1 Tax=Dryococelus australis TaxID=614101 RepID=A0ABQ9GCK0_9NEOP|nr:hypothetical protein PR048_029140 [Dryococelus australis]